MCIFRKIKKIVFFCHFQHKKIECNILSPIFLILKLHFLLFSNISIRNHGKRHNIFKLDREQKKHTHTQELIHTFYSEHFMILTRNLTTTDKHFLQFVEDAMNTWDTKQTYDNWTFTMNIKYKKFTWIKISLINIEKKKIKKRIFIASFVDSYRMSRELL